MTTTGPLTVDSEVREQSRTDTTSVASTLRDGGATKSDAHRPARVVIAHDYLTERGGAERVVLAMARAFPGSSIVTSLYEPDLTFPDFNACQVVTSEAATVRPAAPVPPTRPAALCPDLLHHTRRG